MSKFRAAGSGSGSNSHLLIDLGEDSDRESVPDQLIIDLSSEDEIPDVPLPRQVVSCATCKQRGHTSKNCYQERFHQAENTKEVIRSHRVRDHNNDDNPGKEKWRRGEQYTSSVDFRKGFENATDIDGKYNRPARIGFLTKTYIELKRPNKHGKYTAFIYAADDASDKAAHKMLEEWKHEVNPIGSTSSSQNFDRIKPGSIIKSVSAIEDPRRRYVKDFSPDDVFACFYTVPWQLKMISPQSYLGDQAEGLDPIRMDHECYIKVLGSSGKYQFGILGVNEIEVRRACNRLQNLQKNALASDIEFYQFYLVKVVPFSAIRQTIVQKDHAMPKLMENTLDSDEDQLSSSELEGRTVVLSNKEMNPHAWRLWTQEYAADVLEKEFQESDGITMAGVSNTLNELYMETWFRKVFELQPYYLGSMKMRANIGTCAFGRGFAADELELTYFRTQLYKKNVMEADIDSIFTRELGTVEVESTLLNNFLDCDSPFSPDALPGEIFGRSPHFCSVEFAINHGSTELNLNLAFSNMESGTGVATWIMPRDSDCDFDPFFDVNLLDVVNPHLSYNLSARWNSVMNTKELYMLPLPYTNFPDLIKIDPAKAQDYTCKDLFFHYPQSGGNTPVREIKQVQTWRFQITDSDYLVELHRIQIFDCVPAEHGVIDYKAREPRFGVQVYHPKWDTMFAQNASLRIGRRATWAPEEYEFFPAGGRSQALSGSMWERGSGFKEFLRIMAVVEAAICGAHMKLDTGKGKAQQESLEKPLADMLL